MSVFFLKPVEVLLLPDAVLLLPDAVLPLPNAVLLLPDAQGPGRSLLGVNGKTGITQRTSSS